MRLHVSPASASIVTVDGSSLEIAGSVTLQVVWQDDAGRLKEKSSRLLVVIGMSSVKTDVTFRHDFISECGGIELQYDANVLATVISGHDRGMLAAFTATPAPAEEPPMRPQRHVLVSTKDNGDVTLKTDDGIVHWDAGGSFRELSWVWK